MYLTHSKSHNYVFNTKQQKLLSILEENLKVDCHNSMVYVTFYSLAVELNYGVKENLFFILIQ